VSVCQKRQKLRVQEKHIQLNAVENSDDICNDMIPVSNTSEQWVVVDCDDENI